MKPRKTVDSKPKFFRFQKTDDDDPLEKEEREAKEGFFDINVEAHRYKRQFMKADLEMKTNFIKMIFERAGILLVIFVLCVAGMNVYEEYEGAIDPRTAPFPTVSLCKGRASERVGECEKTFVSCAYNGRPFECCSHFLSALNCYEFSARSLSDEAREMKEGQYPQLSILVDAEVSEVNRVSFTNDDGDVEAKIGDAGSSLDIALDPKKHVISMPNVERKKIVWHFESAVRRAKEINRADFSALAIAEKRSLTSITIRYEDRSKYTGIEHEAPVQVSAVQGTFEYVVRNGATMGIASIMAWKFFGKNGQR